MAPVSADVRSQLARLPLQMGLVQRSVRAQVITTNDKFIMTAWKRAVRTQRSLVP